MRPRSDRLTVLEKILFVVVFGTVAALNRIGLAIGAVLRLFRKPSR